MTDRELMQQALEAMGTVGADWICEASHHAKKDQHKWGEPCPLQQRWHIAYQALRERLAQPQQPQWHMAGFSTQTRPATREEKIDRPGVYEVPVEQEPVAHVDHRIHGWPDCFVMEADPPHTSPLYTTPPRREWQGLAADSTIQTVPAQGGLLPDATVNGMLAYEGPLSKAQRGCAECGKSGGWALYCVECMEKVQPCEWVGLTEAEAVQVAIDCGCLDVAWLVFARAIESKLKEKNA